MDAYIHITGAWAELSGVPVKYLEECLTALDPSRFYNRAFREHRWDGTVRLYSGRQFPAGLTDRVVKHLNESGVGVKVIARQDVKPIDLSRFNEHYLPGITLWDHQVKSIRALVQNQRGCVKSPTGCHRKGQKVLMYSGFLRAVEDVVVGDLLMGPDNLPRLVLSLIRGRAREMFRIVPVKGVPFVVNGEHVLSLVRTNSVCYRGKRKDQLNGTTCDVSVYDWLCWSKTQKHLHKLFRVPVAFPKHVVFLARGLGFAAYVHPCLKRCQTGATGRYHRVSISGHCEIIPCRLPRKQAGVRKQKKDVLRTGFKAECIATPEDYYGFTLSGDGRYLLDDFTVTHNSGKCEMIIAAARLFWEERGWRSLIIVPRKGLAAQTYDRMKKYYGDDVTIGMCGDGQRSVGTVTVATAQTLIGFRPRTKKMKHGGLRHIAGDDLLRKLVHDAEVLFLDETHHASSESWFDIAMASSALRRLGLSGTPLKDSEVADMRMTGATGHVIHAVQSTELIGLGLVAKPKIVIVMADNASGEELPYEWYVRYSHDGKTQKVKRHKPYVEAYDQGVILNAHHNHAVIRAVAWLTDHNRQTLMLCRRKDHWRMLKGEMERAGIPFMALWGDTEVTDRTRAKKMLNERRIKAILASTIFDEGEDVPGIEALVLAEGVKVSTNSLQRIGRGMRQKAGDNTVWVVDFAPTCHPKLLEHALARAQAYESEGYEVRILEEWPAPEDDSFDESKLLPFLKWETQA